MATICPTVTATSSEEYRQQMERICHFATHIHIDLMDGKLAPTISPPLEDTWWPHSIRADIHLMYEEPMKHIEQLVSLAPELVIVHAEAKGNFVAFAEKLHAAGIRAGVALQPATQPKILSEAIEHIDHVLIFSGDLGHFGGKANLKLLSKVGELKRMKPDIEIGWDGGINKKVLPALAGGGVDIMNVGGYIQKADDPEASYDTLKALV